MGSSGISTWIAQRCNERSLLRILQGAQYGRRITARINKTGTQHIQCICVRRIGQCIAESIRK